MSLLITLLLENLGISPSKLHLSYTVFITNTWCAYPDNGGRAMQILNYNIIFAKGYLGDESKTKEFFDEEGFAEVGDVGHYDEMGTIYIEGRTNELIRS